MEGGTRASLLSNRSFRSLVLLCLKIFISLIIRNGSFCPTFLSRSFARFTTLHACEKTSEWENVSSFHWKYWLNVILLSLERNALRWRPANEKNNVFDQSLHWWSTFQILLESPSVKNDRFKYVKKDPTNYTGSPVGQSIEHWIYSRNWAMHSTFL